MGKVMDDAVGALGFVAGQVGQLAQHRIDAYSADEPDHHRVRHKPQQRPEPQLLRDNGLRLGPQLTLSESRSATLVS